MKKLICVLLTLFMFACYAERTYEAISMNATFESVREKYGEPIQKDGYFVIDDAMLAFYESGRLQAKELVFENVSDVAVLTDGSFEAAGKLRQGASLEKLNDILGEGREIMYINIADEDEAGTRRVFAWKNAQGQVLEALFELDNGAWALFAVSIIDI